ncbi:MAG: FeoA family protein [Crocinitomicaceae bacterium]|jgi:Fe2+ transport system protein FeoA|nr:FeoA family protein [Crocinitomicaceae bacterium]
MIGFNLSDLKVGDKATISGLSTGDNHTALLALGFMRGKSIEVSLRAPFNGPMAVRMGQTLVSLRPEEALQVFVDKL